MEPNAAPRGAAGLVPAAVAGGPRRGAGRHARRPARAAPGSLGVSRTKNSGPRLPSADARRPQASLGVIARPGQPAPVRLRRRLAHGRVKGHAGMLATEPLEPIDGAGGGRRRAERVADVRGAALRSLGRVDEALAMYDEASRPEPRGAPVRHIVGLALPDMGRHGGSGRVHKGRIARARLVRQPLGQGRGAACARKARRGAGRAQEGRIARA